MSKKSVHIQDLEKALEEKSRLLSEKDAAYASLETQYNNLLAAAKQLAADFDNFRKRISAEQQKEKAMATKELVTKLLPVLDQFSLCIANSAHNEEFVKGVLMINSQLSGIMEDAGLKPVSALNQTFDPRIHEALMFIQSDKEDNTIVEEIQKGYLLHSEIIRTSKVKVAKKEVQP